MTYVTLVIEASPRPAPAGLGGPVNEKVYNKYCQSHSVINHFIYYTVIIYLQEEEEVEAELQVGVAAHHQAGEVEVVAVDHRRGEEEEGEGEELHHLA